MQHSLAGPGVLMMRRRLVCGSAYLLIPPAAGR